MLIVLYHLLNSTSRQCYFYAEFLNKDFNPDIAYINWHFIFSLLGEKRP